MSRDTERHTYKPVPESHFLPTPPRVRKPKPKKERRGNGPLSGLTPERAVIIEAAILARRAYLKQYGLAVLQAEFQVSEATITGWCKTVKDRMAKRGQIRSVT